MHVKVENHPGHHPPLDQASIGIAWEKTAPDLWVVICTMAP